MTDRIYSLQVLRFLAAMSIVFEHMLGTPFEKLSLNGFGVDVFFVLSGFIMCVVSQGREPAAFFFDRLIRIVPIYWLLTILVAVLAAVAPSLMRTTSFDWQSLLSSLLFFPYERSSGLVQPMLFVGWTLNYEMFFYTIFTFCLFARARAPIFMLLFLITIAAAGYLLEFDNVPLQFWSNSIILDFGLGIVIFYFWRARGDRNLYWLIPIGLALATLSFMSPIWLPREIGRGLPAALLVWGALYVKVEHKGMWAPLIVLGDASYSLYLTHPFVIQGVGALVDRVPQSQEFGLLIGMVTIVVASLLAVASFYFFERPIQKWLKKIPLGSAQHITLKA